MQPAAKGSDVEMTTIAISPDGGHGEMRDFSDLSMDVSLCSAKLKTLIEDKTYFEPKADTQLWTSRLSYTLAAVGSAVGLGNIWRFPYLCYRNGGATFLIPYFISLFALGIPLFALEFTLGQGTGKGALGAVSVHVRTHILTNVHTHMHRHTHAHRRIHRHADTGIKTREKERVGEGESERERTRGIERCTHIHT